MRQYKPTEYYTPRDVERRHGINRRRLARYRREGRGPAFIITRHGLVLYPARQWRNRRR